MILIVLTNWQYDCSKGWQCFGMEPMLQNWVWSRVGMMIVSIGHSDLMLVREEVYLLLGWLDLPMLVLGGSVYMDFLFFLLLSHDLKCNIYWSTWLWTGHFFGQQYNAGGGGKRPGVVSDDETQVEICLNIASWKLVKARNWNSQGARRELTLYQND